jgi:hypothetical protein
MSERITTEEGEMEEVLSGESEIIHDLGKGVIAGFAGTAAVGGLFLLKSATGVLPHFDFVDMLTMLSGYSWPGAGWIMYFLGGGVALGALFAFLDSRNEAASMGSEMMRGAIFATLVWLILMLVFMPVYGGGVFGMAFGVGVPVFMLAANILYGVVMGAVYESLSPEPVES